MPLIPLEDTKRLELGVQVRAWVDNGLQALGRAPYWWEQVERFHRNESPAQTPDGTAPGETGNAQFHIPFSQPRQDMLSAQVCAVVGKQHPYMLTDDEDGVAEAKQEAVHDIWQDAGFEHELRKLATIATDTDCAFARWAPTDHGRIQIKAIHPTNFVCTPATSEGIEGAVCVGHRFTSRIAQIEALRKSGDYYPEQTPLTATADDGTDNTGAETHAGTQDVPLIENENQTGAFWDLIVRLDLDEKGEKRYRCTLAYDTSEILCLEDYTPPYAWYSKHCFVGDPVLFWPGRSVGRNLYPCQDAYNKLWSEFYAATQKMSKVPVIGPSLDSGEKYSEYKDGDYFENDSPVQPWSPNFRPQLQTFPMILASLEKTGDQIARISQNTMGAQVAGSATATEQSIIASGVAVGTEEYIANFTLDLGRMAELTMFYVHADYDAFAENYGPIEVPTEEEAAQMQADQAMAGGMQVA